MACVRKKGALPAPARDLYQSPWFKKARALVEARGGRWYILSAKHGLLAPSTQIAPYEKTLLNAPKAERLAWAKGVIAELARQEPPQPVVLLAGKRYREFLAPLLAEACYAVEMPLEGKGIGSQLAWLKERISDSRARMRQT